MKKTLVLATSYRVSLGVTCEVVDDYHIVTSSYIQLCNFNWIFLQIWRFFGFISSIGVKHHIQAINPKKVIDRLSGPTLATLRIICEILFVSIGYGLGVAK